MKLFMSEVVTHYSYKGRTITQQTDGHVHFDQQFLPQAKVISMLYRSVYVNTVSIADYVHD